MVKIPSALKWMMDRRARILGEMKKVERRFDAREAILVKEIEKNQSDLQTQQERLLRVQALRRQHLAQWQLNLDGIDNALGQHKVMVETDLIRPLRGQDNAWLLPHGAMSRFILRALREAEGEILCTQEIALFVANEGKLEIHPEDFRAFKISVRRRLRALNTDGLLRRVEIGNNCMESRWAAAKDVADRVPKRRGRPPKAQ